MKKLIVFTALILCSYSVFSQEVGVRVGNALGNNVAVDAILKTGKFNRIHADVSFGTGVGIEALWDFINRPLGSGGFNWYVGAGPSMLIDDPFIFAVSAEGGLEYRFKTAPIALGLDWRPALVIVQDFGFRGGDFGFNARYIFGHKK